MTPPVAVRVAAADALTPGERADIIALCAATFVEPFDRLFELLPGSTHVLLTLDGRLVSHAAWVTRWLQPAGGGLLRTAYVEAVATAADHRGRGLATAALREVAGCVVGYDLAALSPSDAGFYARLGWELWRGPLAVRTPGGVVPTPGEGVMVLRLPGTPELDLDAGLSAEWRDGEVW